MVLTVDKCFKKLFKCIATRIDDYTNDMLASYTSGYADDIKKLESMRDILGYLQKEFENEGLHM